MALPGDYGGGLFDRWLDDGPNFRKPRDPLRRRAVLEIIAAGRPADLEARSTARGEAAILLILAIAALALPAVAFYLAWRAPRYSSPKASSNAPLTAPSWSSPRLQTNMRRMQAGNTIVVKAVFTPMRMEPKGRLALVNEASAMARVARDIRDESLPAAALHVSQSSWEARADELVGALRAFALTAADTKTSQLEVKNAYKRVAAACAHCHDAFPVDAP
jgi:hypothetical protein